MGGLPIDESEIIVNADKNFYDVLDVKNFDYPVATLKMSSIGLIKNLTTGEIQAIKEREFSGMSMFVVKNGNLPIFDFSNYILTSETELSQRFLRASHWVRNGKNESNIQLKILFYWFALEALLKESDSDNIGGIIRWSLGFPNGRLRSELSSRLLQQLESHNKYRYWGKRIEESLDKIRIFRNNSVHHGFRIKDFSNNDLKLYENIMIYSVSRCSALVKRALLNNIDSLSELKEYLPYLFEMNSNVVNDVHHNIIYSLQNSL